MLLAILHQKCRQRRRSDIDIAGAIEAKTTRTATKNDIKSLLAIGDEGTFRHRILVCCEPRAREVDGIAILPWREFIDRLWTETIF